MKLTSILLLVVGLFVVNANAARPQCGGGAQTMEEGVDILPWSLTKPFPWDNISGLWKLGDDSYSYVRARLQSTNATRKILSIQVLGDGPCSKPFARGTGYIDYSEKNVVRAILYDSNFRYQMKLGLFDARDILDTDNKCNARVMAVSMQIIGHSNGNKAAVKPIDPSLTETHNMMLKKVSQDPSASCAK